MRSLPLHRAAASAGRFLRLGTVPIVALALCALYVASQAELDPDEYARNHPARGIGAGISGGVQSLELDKETAQECVAVADPRTIFTARPLVADDAPPSAPALLPARARCNSPPTPFR